MCKQLKMLKILAIVLCICNFEMIDCENFQWIKMDYDIDDDDQVVQKDYYLCENFEKLFDNYGLLNDSNLQHLTYDHLQHQSILPLRNENLIRKNITDLVIVNSTLNFGNQNNNNDNDHDHDHDNQKQLYSLEQIYFPTETSLKTIRFENVKMQVDDYEYFGQNIMPLINKQLYSFEMENCIVDKNYNYRWEDKEWFTSATLIIAIQNCGFRQIAEDAFVSAINLRMISLNGNQLNEYDRRWFNSGKLKYLWYIDLSDNDIAGFYVRDPFKNMPALKVLKVKGNRIRTLRNIPFASFNEFHIQSKIILISTISTNQF